MSKDLGKTLLARTDTIVDSWIKTIQKDVDIESSKGMTYQAVRNSIPLVVEALATLLSQALTNQPQKLEDKGWEHGIMRAEQGYDVAEIVREYSLLRKIIFTILKPDLLVKSGDEILKAIELVDSLIDRVISLSLESYLETQLQELEQVRGQLLLTNQELTRLVATQKEDISHLAHELKSPLNSIMGFSTLLLQQQQKVTQGKDTSLSLQLTEKVITNSRQLLRLINDILEISRYETGKIQLNLQSTDLRSLIRVITETLEISTIQKNLEIILNCDLAPEQIRTDPLKLQQIITNLLSNAIRYTDSGTITITCLTDNNDQWSLIVTDTGVGIDPEAQTQVFEPYYRASSKGSYSPHSTGLGLAIVDKLVKLLQGEIDLVSQPGEGSTFTVTFPTTITDKETEN
ncbi:HAMP domain-containing sensor histidine kinase [Pleurocapsa sp. PCC 7319]|uniref:sensor histidine kinase n=1 Tax=Pleurocapsa sp. PCC 7319 TaxID=118161 RepID=UPI000349FBBD|nr:sensor histidine kinase [Pleurocapsa sp. PCC 7319]